MSALPSCLAMLLLLLLPGCGGGAAGASTDAKSASNAASPSDGSDGEESATSENEDEPAFAETAKAAACDDGTCSVCGDGICPSGWYCDEKASACSWLTECADKPSCSCVTRVLGASCRCREEAGGLKVSCD